jgi:carboxymethylenebutenolidase
MTTTHIEVTTAGGPAAAELVLPAGEGKVPGIVVVHEWWGINDDIRRIAGRFAAEGIAALVVDLYGGQSTTDPAEAFRLSNEMRTLRSVEIIAGGVAALASHARGSGKVAVTGFCLGGAMTLAAACQVDGLAAAVPFYGTPKDEHANGWRAKAPILGHYAKNDGFVSIDRARKIAQAVNEAGGSMELHEYDAGHAFMREADVTAYDAASAALAWGRTITFLKKQLVF